LIAKEQFIDAGFEKQAIFPFGYFVSRKGVNLEKSETMPQKGLKLVFIGTLIRIKGLDIAIKAVEALYSKGYKISLDIYGPGNHLMFISPSSPCVFYKGIIPQGESQRIIINYDMLILPSRHDGWGLVVNEALLQGTPVVVSDKVGAKCLVENSGCGMIFQHDNFDDLEGQLESVLINPEKLDYMKKCSLKVSSLITPEIGAKYLLDVINYHFLSHQTTGKPSAIWCGVEPFQ
jgi:glycosyltransferase involved in cell wall biosynthesis